MPNTERKTNVNFLATNSYQAISFTVPSKLGKKSDETGTLTVYAGTVLPSNDANAKGILLEDTDVTNGDAACALLIDAVIYEDRLPEKITAEAQASLKKILFI